MMKGIKSNRLYLLSFFLLYFAVAYTVMYYCGITCVFIEFLGIPCPGCGMTRAFLSLLTLDFYQAVKYNVLIFFMPYIFMYIFCDFKHKAHNAVLLGIAVVAMVNWIIKIFMFF